MSTPIGLPVIYIKNFSETETVRSPSTINLVTRLCDGGDLFLDLKRKNYSQIRLHLTGLEGIRSPSLHLKTSVKHFDKPL